MTHRTPGEERAYTRGWFDALAEGPDAYWLPVRDELRRLCDEIAADNSMHLAPGWMARDACVAKVRAVLGHIHAEDYDALIHGPLNCGYEPPDTDTETAVSLADRLPDGVTPDDLRPTAPTPTAAEATPHVHPECLAAIRAHLDAGYHQHSEQAQRMYDAGRPKNAKVCRRMATALGWASGWIKGMAG